MDEERWQRISDLCQEGLARAPAARAAFLAEACGDDTALRREVESLLAIEPLTRDFLETPPRLGTITPPARKPLVGGTLGPYRIERLLGAGGMGEVYRARHLRLDREVAVKVLPSSLAADADHLARFEREARLLAALNHPNVLTVHDVGTQDGIPYVVAELLEGQTLRDLLVRQEVPAAQALNLVLQAALGLAAAHRQGIVHRDLKPENLFLTTDGRVKVLDFGLARLVSSVDRDAVSPPTTHTQPGLLAGTVAYMAPEQLDGGEADARSDVFALGLVLHEMLTGRHPFRKDTVQATIDAILHEQVQDLPAVQRGVAPGLGAVVRRCLEKRPALRFRDAHDLVQALDALLTRPTEERAARPADDRSPYPGLRSFSAQDAGVFFGREAEVEALWEKIRARRLLAVIGPSGAGKTSFLHAGVLPARPRGWSVLACTPGLAPMRSLGQALAPELAHDVEALQRLVTFGDEDVAFTLMRRWRETHAEALLVIDQFEELFTLNAPDVPSRFAAFLRRLVDDAGIRVVLSLRDDFLVSCSALPPLAPVLADLTVLPPMSHDALRRAILEPARMRGCRFDDEGLADEMVSALEGSRAALPLLAFAVARLWERRDRGRRLITRESYAAIGGVAGALAQHAEATLESIGGRQDLVREIFRGLVTADGTRAVADRDDLLSAFPDREAAGQVLEALVNARLLTSYEVEGAPSHPARHRVEIAHESLLSAWPRLVRWQAQDQEGALLRDQLRQAAHLWDEKGRPADLLWTGTAFRELALWRERYAAPLTAVEAAYAAAMFARDRRRRVRRWAAMAALVAMLVTVAVAIGVSRQQAVDSARQAEASRLAAIGRLELDRFPTAAVAYALESLETADTSEGRYLAVEALWRGPAARILAAPPGTACSRVAFSPDGASLACAGFPGSVVLWDDEARARTWEGLPSKADIREVAFDPAGRHLITWVPGDPVLRALPLRGGPVRELEAWPEWVSPLDGDAVVLGPASPGSRLRLLRRWPFGGGDPMELARWQPPADLRLDQPGLRPVDFHAAAGWLAYGDRHDVLLRPLSPAGSRERRLSRHGARVREVKFDPAGTHVLSTDESGLFCLWSLADGRLVRELRTRTPHRYSIPVFDPAGRRVAWMSGEGTTHVWDLDAPMATLPAALRRTDVRDAGGEAFDPRGHWLASAGWDSVALWPLGAPRVTRLAGHVEGPILDLAFSQDSRLLASCARDGARLWPLGGSQGAMRRVSIGEDFYCYGARFAPDGRHLAVSSPYAGVFLVPLDGGPPRLVTDFRGNRSAPMPLAFDAAGRTLAVGTMYAAADEDMRLEVADLGTGTRRTLPLREPGSSRGDGYASSANDLEYVADGRLLIAGGKGLRRWDPATGAIDRLIWGDRFAAVDVSAAGDVIVALVGTLSGSRLRLFEPELLRIDVDGQVLGRITSHGHALTPTLALDRSGRVVVTGDANGVVRVGPVDGGLPHVLIGHDGPVNRVAVSPDGRWVASASGSEIRLWPMPDLSKPPLHTMPREQLLATLGALTNLRVVRDPLSATGWSTKVGPFPGWKQVPTW